MDMRVVAAFLLALTTAARPEAPPVLVVCAPGYPGSTAEAQKTMDALASAVARGAGLPAAGLSAVYLADEEEGLARMGQPDAALTLVPLPFYAKHAAALKLEPRLVAVAQGASGPTEVWSLVAGKGRVASPAALDGFTLVSSAGYAPGFVRAALAGWGQLPPGLRITASSQVLSALRRAAAGERTALLLDASQAAALPGLPFAGDLEVVARSAPLPGALLATVGGHLPPSRLGPLEKALLGLSRVEGGPAALQGMQVSAFQALSADARAAVERLARAPGQ
jgi:hypothetical protein